MPARASMLTGTYPHNHHIQDNAGLLPVEDESYARLLQEAGYATAYVGKTHFGSDRPGRDLIGQEADVMRRGFDYVHQIPGPMALARRAPPQPALGGAGAAGALPGGLPPAGRRPGRGGLGQPPPGGRVPGQLRRRPGRRLAAGLPGSAAVPADRRLRRPPPALRRPRAVRLPLPPGGPAGRPSPPGSRGTGSREHVRRYWSASAGGDRRGESAPGAPARGRRGCASPGSGWPTTGARSP